MNQERWRQLESLYNQAQEMNEDQRTAFLREACGGDEDLRRDLEGLFAEEPKAASFLENAALQEIAHEFASTASPSWIGRQIGNYQFVSTIGAGGMGEVYQAHDTKLKRDVAIKILHDEFSFDPDRIRRFRREAQLLASLNHSNIAAIYNLEEADGYLFLILELVSGETLADRIKRGKIPVEEALKIALQIAEALEGAHDKNVIHRDLKPANIKVTAQGNVKVLDFGLAKAFLSDTDGNLSNSPTIGTSATQLGVIVGTAAYMSPEQARGQAVDRRSDVWAFGCVLFEMLSGRGAFGGETVSDVIASVLKTTPDWSSLPGDLHPRILHLLERCLEKETKDRHQGMAEARVEIRKVLADAGSVSGSPVAETRAGLRYRSRWITVIAGAAVIASTLVWYFKPNTPKTAAEFSLSPAKGQSIGPGPTSIPGISPNGEQVKLTTPAAPVKFSFSPPEDQGFGAGGRTSSLAISRDGKLIVYIGAKQLYRGVTAKMEASSQPIQGARSDVALGQPIFSPNNQWVAYLDVGKIGNSIKKIPLNGGTAVTLVEESPNFGYRDLSWTSNDTILFATTEGILEVPAATGGTPKIIIKAPEGERLGRSELLPDGKSLLFSATTATGDNPWDSAKIFVQRLNSGDRTLVWDGGGDPRYVAAGLIVYAQASTLFALPVDAGSLKPKGEPTPIVESVRRGRGGTETANYDVSNTGTLVYAPGTPSIPPADVALALVDFNGEPHKLKVDPRQYRSPHLSNDGRQLAVEVLGKDGQSSIWIYDMSGNTAVRRLPKQTGSNTHPIWKHDNKTVTFRSNREGTWGIYSQRIDGSDAPKPLTPGEPRLDGVPESWSLDDRTLSYQKGFDVWTFSMATLKSTLIRDLLNFNVWGSVISPDGKWIAYCEQGEKAGVHVQPLPPTGEIVPVSEHGENGVVWNAQNRLFIRQANNGTAIQLMPVDVSTKGPSIEFQNGHSLLFQDVLMDLYRTYDMTPDGKQFVMIVSAGDSSAKSPPPARPQIKIVMNWFEELKASLAPR